MPIYVSVIITIYNSEKYIERTMESICSQTLKNIEIICVNDCSTDNSLSLLQKFAEKDNRIKIISNETNQGVSLSRNIGIKEAKGKYIGFIDHDDIADDVMYEELYKVALQGDYDMVHSDVYMHEKEYVTIDSYPNNFENGSTELQEQMINYLIFRKKSDHLEKYLCIYGVWNKIYKKELLEKHNIIFYSEKEFPNEDFIFNLRVMINAGAIGRVSKAFYHNFCHPSSLSNTFSYRSFKLKYKTTLIAKELIEKSNFTSTTKDLFYERLLYKVWIDAVEGCSHELLRNKNGKITALIEIKNILHATLTKEAVKKISIYNTTTNTQYHKYIQILLYYYVKFFTKK